MSLLLKSWVAESETARGRDARQTSGQYFDQARPRAATVTAAGGAVVADGGGAQPECTASETLSRELDALVFRLFLGRSRNRRAFLAKRIEEQ